MTTTNSDHKTALEGVPMIPNAHFLLGHLPLMRDDDFRPVPFKFSYEYADENGRCCFWLGPSTPALSVSKAKDVQLVLKSSTHRTVFALMKKHLDECLGKRNILLLMGKEWKMNRSAIVKALHATSVQASHGEQMREATAVLIDSLSHKLKDENQTVFEIGDLMKSLTMDIFGRTALSQDFECCSNLELSPIAKAFEYLTSEMMRRISGMLDPTNYIYSLPLAKNRRFHQERSFLRNYIQEITAKRRQELKASPDDCPKDLLTHLIQVQSEEDDDDETLSDVLMSLLFAGYETTSVALTYALYLVSTHKQVEDNCVEEIRRVGSSNLDGLVYIEAVMLESLRLYPPAISTTRSLEKPLVLDGITVPEGTYLYVPIWGIQRDNDHFPNAESFLPERWACRREGVWKERSENDDVDASSSDVPMANRDAFVAFSAGARSCAGRRFALQEMKIALAMLLEAFEFSLGDDNYELTPYRAGLVQSPKGGIAMNIKHRSK